MILLQLCQDNSIGRSNFFKTKYPGIAGYLHAEFYSWVASVWPYMEINLSGLNGEDKA